MGTTSTATALPSSLGDAVRRACDRIAPTWPLDRFIAVNPFWGMIDRPLSEVAGALSAQTGAQLLMPRQWYRERHQTGQLRDEHLRRALQTTGSSCSLEHLRGLMESPQPRPMVRSRLTDVADASRDLVHQMSWRSFVIHSVSQFCASFFDEGQATYAPARHGGLYASWRRLAQGDRSPELLMGFGPYRQLVGELPATWEQLIPLAFEALDVSEHEREHYAWSLLLDQNGWASWCAFLRWSARHAGTTDDSLFELLAIRLAWEWLLFRGGGDAVARRFRLAAASWPRVDQAASEARADDWVLQEAVEHAWRAPLLEALPAGFEAARPSNVSVQAVFCIDVRSEPLRRGLEAASSSVQTLGFAGFFGVPLQYRLAGATDAQPHLPGLLAPKLTAADTGLTPAAERRRERHLEHEALWSAAKADAVSTFTFVEAMGIGHAAKLISDGFGLGRAASSQREPGPLNKPRLLETVAGAPVDDAARSELAASMLRAMSLTRDFARLVLLVGHGSRSRNNPHAAGLDCGACCGQTGEVSARVAAALLNEPRVREGLAKRGIVVPATCRFIAGLHDTTVDDVTLFDVDELPASHAADRSALEVLLREAGDRARAARSVQLGLWRLDARQLHEATRRRAADWAEVRPEWGLANNAAFIVAPRERTRHLDLEGRVFLHDYRHEEDDGFGVLELIMTAPMVVTHWINLQYYASTVDNLRYGSGNKVLHNVVGGHLGVFEGNGGDLRIGLPLQSVHDGTREVHTPLRLSVFIEAPRAAIDRVLERHAHVRALVDNGWLALLRIDATAGRLEAHRRGQWVVA